MTPESISVLIALLPDDAPYLRKPPEPMVTSAVAQSRLEFIEKLTQSLSDPAFGWHFIRSFIEMGCPLPCDVIETSLLRAYWFLTDQNYADPDVVQALCLERNRKTKAVVDAILLIQRIDQREICQLLTISPEALKIYTDLFFNIPDRQDEPEYIREQVYPETRAVILDPNYLANETDEFLLRRMAYDHGLEALKHLAGFRSGFNSKVSAAQAAENFKQAILTQANLLLRLGGANSSAPVLKLAQSIVTADRKAGEAKESIDQNELSLSGMSIDCSILEHVKRAMAPDSLLLRQQQLDREAKDAKN